MLPNAKDLRVENCSKALTKYYQDWKHFGLHSGNQVLFHVLFPLHLQFLTEELKSSGVSQDLGGIQESSIITV